MNKHYRELDFFAGDIDRAMKELQKHYPEPVCINFNGQIIYSDVDTLDSAYQKITGKTKAEFDEMCRVEREEYERKKREHEQAIPELTAHWIQKGREVLEPKYYEHWVKLVPVRLNDLYQGMELGACLEIVDALNKGRFMHDVSDIFDNQAHSGMSASLVLGMVWSLCERGESFCEFVV